MLLVRRWASGISRWPSRSSLVRVAQQHAHVGAAPGGGQAAHRGEHGLLVEHAGRQVAVVDDHGVAGIADSSCSTAAISLRAFRSRSRLVVGALDGRAALAGGGRYSGSSARRMVRCSMPASMNVSPSAMEAVALVEADGLHLGMQAHAVPAERAGPVDQRLQQRRADAAAAPVGQHRHAADGCAAASGARCRSGRAVGIARQHVPAFGVELVPLFLDRHLLFVDEHRFADGAQGVAVGRPVGRLDVEARQPDSSACGPA